MKHDVVVVGAGLGGLTAGARLAKSGMNVLVLEQHTLVGGCATTYRRGGYNIEIGLHEMDGLDERDGKRKIFEELGVFGKVEFVRVPEFYRFIHGDTDIVIPDNAKEAQAVLLERFPHEAAGIKKFFGLVTGIHMEASRVPDSLPKLILTLPFLPILMRRIIWHRNSVVGDVIDGMINDDELKLILLANLGYYHDDPYELSMLYFSAAQGSYFAGGGWFIKGGSQKLSDHLAGVIKDNGGRVLTRADVTKIIIENGKATGVEYVDGRFSGKQTALADMIVANAAAPNVVNELAPSLKDSPLAEKIRGMKLPPSLTVTYLGFNKPVRELGNKYYSTIVCDKSVRSIKQLKDILGHEDYRKRPFIFLDYSQIDSGLAPEGKSVGALCVMDYNRDWEGLSESEYREKKARVEKALLDNLERLIPGAKGAIDYVETGTPLTITRYTKNPHGSIYGFAQTPEQAIFNRMPQQSPIENLVFASAWTMPGGGFSGAILSGSMAADLIKRKWRR